ncbi:MAG: hypothetical protein H6727_17050 [Myxococcales bacterium]|nr:hypothetical protein [Myxococcales bacterium]
MRMRALMLLLCLVCVGGLSWSMQGCTEPTKESEKTTDAGEVVAEKVSEPIPEETGPTCKTGEAVNACQGDGTACKSQRDCDKAKGYDQDGTCFSGVCAVNAEKASVLTKDEMEPDLSCIDTPPALPQGPEKATWWGEVESFGLEGDTPGLKVAIYEHQEFMEKGTSATVLGTDTAKAVTDEGGCTPTCADGRVCSKGTCVRTSTKSGYKIGYFEIKDLPTNKRLVVIAEGTGYIQTVLYNLWIPADKVDANGFFQESVFAISEVTKTLIPALAGISQIEPGNSAIAGEVQDCQGKQLYGATVTLSLRPEKLSYFNGKGDQPDPTQNETNKDGTYGALNIKPDASGKMKVIFAAKVSGQMKKLLDYEVRALPDAISILTVRPWYPGRP